MGGITSYGSGYGTYTGYAQIASGNRINTAADDAAGLAIANKEEEQTRSLDAGTNNMASAKDALNVADGALGNITDSLQRMRELAIQASNGLNTDSDKQAIQEEVEQLKQGIADMSKNTTFNTKNLLDGSQEQFNLSTGNSDMTVTTGNATLQSLGIEDFDVTGDFDLDKLDAAIDKVDSMRSKSGAQSNGIEYAMNANNYTSYNTTAALSRTKDLDIGKAMTEQKKAQVLQQYQMQMQRRRTEDEQNQTTRLLGING